MSSVSRCDDNHLRLSVGKMQGLVASNVDAAAKKVYGLQNADSSAQNVSLCEAFARISEQILELFSEVLVTLTFDL